MPNMYSVSMAGLGMMTNGPNSSLSHFPGAVRPMADVPTLEG